MSFGWPKEQDYASLGTTPPMFVAREGTAAGVRPGSDYFYVQIHAAQAAFRGSIFARAKRLIVASTVGVSRPGLIKESMTSLQRSRAVRPDRAEQLGLRPNLIGLVPAVMTDFSISLDFIVDQQDRLASLASLINDDDFLSVVSMAPGASVVAKTVSGLAQKLIQTFVPAEERRPILEFMADFNLSGEGLPEGYYVILGSRDENNPLPKPIPELAVSGSELLMRGDPVTQLSYVILNVTRVSARGRDLGQGALWESKLREAEDEAQIPLGDDEAAWEKCRTLLREAQVLLRADPNYLREEADRIVLASLATCRGRLGRPERKRGAGSAKLRRALPDEGADLALLDWPSDTDVGAVLDSYAKRVMDSREQLPRIAR